MEMRGFSFARSRDIDHGAALGQIIYGGIRDRAALDRQAIAPVHDKDCDD
jgi:IS4 transposase